MDLLQRVRGALKNIEGREPWDYGFDGRKANLKAKSAWAALTIEERLGVSRYNPYRVERALLCELYQKGLTQAVLSQISGLSLRSIEKITGGKRNEQDQ